MKQDEAEVRRRREDPAVGMRDAIRRWMRPAAKCSAIASSDVSVHNVPPSSAVEDRQATEQQQHGEQPERG